MPSVNANLRARGCVGCSNVVGRKDKTLGGISGATMDSGSGVRSEVDHGHIPPTRRLNR
ncbi:MAG TPA: hypothetical protein V6D10_03360 [Trichocoleus sp.]